MHEKIYKCVFVVMLILFAIFFGGFCIQTSRLHASMEQCAHYRAELEAASDRQSEIRDVVGRTGEVLSKTANSVAELRIQLQEVEDNYNYMWKLLSNDNNCVDNKGDK